MNSGRLKFFFGIVIWALLPFVAVSSAEAKPAPGVSGALSIIPGLGQVANGDAAEGLGWFATSVGLVLTRNRYLGQIGFDLWLYNMYDAYKDAGAKRTKPLTLGQNWIAAFNPVNAVDPI